MRIVYGVMGFGRGHATRVASVLPALMKNHDVLILAGGDAYDYLKDRFPVERIPTIGYQYNRSGEYDLYKTLDVNLRLVLNVVRKGSLLQKVIRRVQQHDADVVISDSEFLTHRAARELGIPRISFDHIGVMVYGDPKLSRRDKFMSRRDVEGYKVLMGKPQRAICASFYPMRNAQPGVDSVGAILRDDVLKARESVSDEGHVLAYFNKADALLGPRPEIPANLQKIGRPVILYGTGCREERVVGNITYKPLSKEGFLHDLKTCHALISTAGNQLCGEAIYLGKPLLVVPDDSVEQRMNAEELAAMGVGERATIDTLRKKRIKEFLSRRDSFIEPLATHASNGKQQAIELLEQYIAELAGTKVRPDKELSMIGKTASILPHLAIGKFIGTVDQLMQPAWGQTA